METVHKVTALRAVAASFDPMGFLEMYRERFVMALAQNYCDGQISWDEYVRTAEVVQTCLSQLRDELVESGQAKRERA